MSEKKQEELYLREAKPDDVELLFCWANEEEVRKNSFCSERITYEEHQRWFERLMEDGNQFQYIMMLGEKPIGQIRLSVFEDTAEIGYSIASEERGLGYGIEIVNLVKEIIYKDLTHIKKLIAKVKPINAASMHCFKKNEFTEKYRIYEFEMFEYKA